VDGAEVLPPPGSSHSHSPIAPGNAVGLAVVVPVVRAGMLGWRPWMVERTVGSQASGVAMVVVRLFGCVGGEERTVGDLEC
jgi:hypothetical protein